MLKGFKAFLSRGNVLDLAIAVIIGAAFNSVVKSLVEDIFTPLLGMLGGLPDFSSWKVGPLMLGSFVNSLVLCVPCPASLTAVEVEEMEEEGEKKEIDL